MEEYTMKKLLTVFAIMLLLPLTASAQDDNYRSAYNGTISIRIGTMSLAGDSDLWDENFDYLTYEMEDFDGSSFGMEYNWFMNDLVTLGFGFDYYSQSVSTEYRDYIADDGLPIYQNIDLNVVPLTVTVKITPFGNGAPKYGKNQGFAIVPWIGGGVGIYAFTYQEDGEFIDFWDDSIFNATFISDSEAAFGYHLAGGLVVPLSSKFDVFAEVRKFWAEGELGPDFEGFEPLDLSGITFIGGASIRF
jgi:hypothetical protein